MGELRGKGSEGRVAVCGEVVEMMFSITSTFFTMTLSICGKGSLWICVDMISNCIVNVKVLDNYEECIFGKLAKSQHCMHSC